MTNDLVSAIASKAYLKDNLRKWLWSRGRNSLAEGRGVLRRRDLFPAPDRARPSQRGKHGYPLEKYQHSGREPRLQNIESVMRMSTGTAETGSLRSFPTQNGDTLVQSTDTGGGGIVIAVDVVDRSGLVLGDISIFLQQAVTAWERPRQGVRDRLTAVGACGRVVRLPGQAAASGARGAGAERAGRGGGPCGGDGSLRVEVMRATRRSLPKPRTLVSAAISATRTIALAALMPAGPGVCGCSPITDRYAEPIASTVPTAAYRRDERLFSAQFKPGQARSRGSGRCGFVSAPIFATASTRPTFRRRPFDFTSRVSGEVRGRQSSKVMAWPSPPGPDLGSTVNRCSIHQGARRSTGQIAHLRP